MKRDLERVQRAALAAKEAHARRDRIIFELRGRYTIRELAAAAGLSHGRVGQIVKEGKHD
jgi:DNA-directed RNA polymerase sigma subunit (sigma70/sigma32)